MTSSISFATYNIGATHGTDYQNMIKYYHNNKETNKLKSLDNLVSVIKEVVNDLSEENIGKIKKEIDKFSTHLKYNLEKFEKYKKSLDGLLKSNQIQKLFDQIQTLYMNELWKQAEVKSATSLASSVDVILIQEMGNKERQFISVLENKGFRIVTPKRRVTSPEGYLCDTAIAIKKEKFVSIQEVNLEFPKELTEKFEPYGQDATIITAQPKNTNVTLAFGSVHSWGFQLYSPENTKKNLSKYDDGRLEKGKKYCNMIAEKLNQLSVDGRVFGGDINNNPENQKSQFDEIRKRGYSCLRIKEKTHVCYGDPEYPEREIDFVFHKRSWFDKILNVIVRLWKTTVEVVLDKTKEPIKFNSDNCSDHKPVIGLIEIKPSYWSKVKTIF